MSINQPMAPIEQTRGGKTPILLVDSFPASIAGNNLLHDEYEVIQAGNDAQAWDFLSQHGARLILYCLGSKHSHTPELLKKLRGANNAKISQIPFFVIAHSETDTAAVSRLLKDGVNKIITQPIDVDNLSRQVERYLGKPDQEQASVNAHQTVIHLDGFCNQAQFIHDLRKELSFAIRNKNELALMLLRLDQFDTALEQGDDKTIREMLLAASGVIREHTHIEDKLAYFGEGVFAILLPAANVIGTRYLGKRLLSDFLAKQFNLGSLEISLSVSIGVSAPEIKPGTTFSEILGLAENRLHTAIEAGGKRVVDHDVPAVATMSPQSHAESPKQRQLHPIQSTNKASATVIYSTAQSDTWRKQARQLEQENHQLLADLKQARGQLEEMEALKKRLQDNDHQKQKNLESLEQLQAELERTIVRATRAERIQDKLKSAEHDQVMIQQHLLEEYEKLQQEVIEKTQQLGKLELDHHKTEYFVTNLKQQLEIQKHEFELKLADERSLRLELEQKLSALKENPPAAMAAQHSLRLSAEPKIHTSPAKIAEAPPPQPVAAEKLFQPQPQVVTSVPKPAASQPQRRQSPAVRIRTKSPWPFRLALLVAIAIAAGSVVYFRDILNNSISEQTTTADVRISPVEKSAIQAKPQAAAKPQPPADSAIQDAEMRLRDAAELEFQRLLHQQADVMLSISANQPLASKAQATGSESSPQSPLEGKEAPTSASTSSVEDWQDRNL